MRRSTLWMCALLVTTTFGCDRVKPLTAKVKQQAATVGTTVKAKIDQLRGRFFHKKPPAAPVAAAPAAPAAPAPEAPPPAPAPAPPPEPAQQVAVAYPPRAQDVPYFLSGYRDRLSGHG